MRRQRGTLADMTGDNTPLEERLHGPPNPNFPGRTVPGNIPLPRLPHARKPPAFLESLQGQPFKAVYSDPQHNQQQQQHEPQNNAGGLLNTDRRPQGTDHREL